MNPPPGWKQVSFAGDCLGGDEDDLYEYQEFDGTLYAKPLE